MNGYVGDTLVGTTGLVALTTGFAALPGPISGGTFAGIDRLEFVSSGEGLIWVLDDFIYQRVPDGGTTVTLLGSALLGLGLLRRKFRG